MCYSSNNSLLIFQETGVRAVTFHPDGRTLFCGLDGSLKVLKLFHYFYYFLERYSTCKPSFEFQVYSWEPVVCHDALDMGWSTLGDLCIDDGKLLGCSYYQNAVAVWVADTSVVIP